jgi:hypothetical protein
MSCISFAPPETITNPECEITKSGMEIFQVLDKGALVYLLDASGSQAMVDENGKKMPKFFERGYDETIYYIDIKTENIKNIYDGMAIYIGDDCFKFDGTYSYSNTIGSKTTVRKIKSVVPRMVPNPAYKIWQEEQSKKEK